jgi:hypothetical protein
MAVPQPPVVNYNPVRVLWTDEETEYLLDQRMYRNDEFWSLNSAGQVEFWGSIAAKINECFGTRFTEVQVKTKWKNLVQEHRVNIFYVD